MKQEKTTMDRWESYFKYNFDNFKYDDYFSFYELSFLLNFNFTFTPQMYDNKMYLIELRNNEFERLELYNNFDQSDYQIYYNKNLLSNTALNNKIDLLFDFFNMKKPNKFFNQYIYNRFLMYRPIPRTSLIDEFHYKSVKNLNIRDFKTIIPLDNNLKFIYTAIVSRLDTQIITNEPPFEVENFNKKLNRDLFEYYKDKLNYDLVSSLTQDIWYFLTVDDSFIDYTDEQLNLHDLKLGLTIDNITAFLKNSSELFNAFVEETQTITETISQDEDVTATQTQTKQAKIITKEITDEDTSTANENNKSADYIINTNTDINNIDDLYSNKYSDKATQNKNTFTLSKNKTYNETLNDSGDNVENQDITARDSETTKQHMSTLNKYKGIDIDLKVYNEIVDEITNTITTTYDFLRLGIS